MVFDSERLLCEWPWLVPKCASGLGVNLASEYVYGGYSSGQGVGLLLEQYDGLGSLGVVKLGGITGKIEQPIAKVYSNVGTAGLGYNAGGYINQDGYILGSGLGLGGLSYKATQSLQNAGLLKTDLGAGAGIGVGIGSELGVGYQQGSGVLTGLNGQSNIHYSGVGSPSSAAGLGTSEQYQYNSGTAGASGVEINAANLNIAGAYGAKTSNADALNTKYVSGVAHTGVDLGSSLDYNAQANANAFGAKSSQNQLQYHGGNVVVQGGLSAGNLASTLDYSAEGKLGTISTGNLASTLDYSAGAKLGAINTGNLASTLDYSAGGKLGTINTGYVQGGPNTLQVQGNLGVSLGHNVGSTNGLGATSSQSFTQYHDQAGQTLQANVGSDIGSHDVNIVIGNADINQGEYNSVQYEDNIGTDIGYNAENAFGVKLNQGQVFDQVNLNQGAAYSTGNAFGAKSSQSFIQYQGGSAGQGVAGNINIVGGGYSAVGESKSGVEINGESADTSVYSTASPISVTTFASVPTVTSVPIPALKTASGFESYKGGVVANVPELQYKIQDSTDLANISANFVKFASTTPSTLLVNEGYEYQRPRTFFNQNAYKVQNGGAGATSYSYQSLDSSINKGGSSAEQDITVSGYGGLSTVGPSVAVVQQNVIPTVSIQKNEGYVYSKPSIAFEEGPAKTVSSFSISSNARPVSLIQEQVQPIIPVQPVAPVQPVIPVQPIVNQPVVAFGEKQQPVIVSSTVQPIVKQTPQVYLSSTVAPIIEQKVKAQPAVSYSFTQNFASEGDDYPKPSIAFDERPIIQTYQHVRPAVISKFSIRKPNVQPVNTYTVQQPAVVQPVGASYSYEQDYKSEGYHYSKPSIAFEGTPVVSQPIQPAVVSTYHYGAVQPTYTYQKPAISSYAYKDVAQKTVGVYQPSAISTYNYATSSTPKPLLLEQTVRPAVVSSYSYTPSTTSAPAVAVQNLEFGGYDYPKPAVSFAEEPAPIVTSYENKQPIQEVPFVKQKAYVTGQAKSYQYNQRFEAPATKVVVEDYQAPVKASVTPVANYQLPSSTPVAPVLVENYQAAKTYNQAVDTSNSYFFNNVNSVSSTPAYEQQYYSTPVYQEPVKQVYVQSTPRPSYKSTISSVLTAKVQPVTQAPNFYYYDSRLLSTPKATVDGGYVYSKPKIQFEERPIQPVVSPTYLPPTKEYLPVQTGKPISSFSFSSLDTQYQTISTPRPFTVSTTPLTREYIPVTTKVQVTTPQPVFVVPEVSTPTYVPVRSKIRYTSRPVEITSPVRTYVPVSITTPSPSFTPTTYVHSSPVEVSSRAPLEVTTLSRDYLPVRSRVRVTTTGVPFVDAGYSSRRPAKVTIIKQNDFHPMLAAKLGAQCTCVSNSLNLRKKQKIIIVEDDDDDDGYVVANEGGKVVENYQYNPTIEITPSPQVYLQSTTSQALVAPYAVKQRVRVRPTQPVTEAVDIFLKNDVSSVGASDAEITGAVRTGLKLVKQAAKEGAEEAISNLGGASVRDTIDCQRAGLFRHPTQCNKFYACRWDCAKNKFTLHTFNCPVHLTFDNSLGACNWPSQGPACLENTLLPSE